MTTHPAKKGNKEWKNRGRTVQRKTATSPARGRDRNRGLLFHDYNMGNEASGEKGEKVTVGVKKPPRGGKLK